MGLASKRSVDSRDVGFLVSLAENLQPHHLGTTLINTLTHHTLFRDDRAVPPWE